jgi:hypothetical protein
MNRVRIDKDSEGVKYKYLDRSCKQCKRFPCFEGIEICKSDFAKYGCRQYKE